MSSNRTVYVLYIPHPGLRRHQKPKEYLELLELLIRAYDQDRQRELERHE